MCYSIGILILINATFSSRDLSWNSILKTSPKLHFNSATGERVDSLIGFTGKAILILTLLNMGFWFPWFFQTLSGLLSAKLELSFANRDFVNYWLAGRLILSGDVSTLFSQATHQAALELATGLQGMEIRNWSYPPHFLLLLGWLGWLPYPLSLIHI